MHSLTLKLSEFRRNSSELTIVNSGSNRLFQQGRSAEQRLYRYIHCIKLNVIRKKLDKLLDEGKEL